jgi:hypothetical protein
MYRAYASGETSKLTRECYVATSPSTVEVKPAARNPLRIFQEEGHTFVLSKTQRSKQNRETLRGKTT